MSVRVIVALAAALLLVLFAVQNTEPVGVHLIVWQVTAPASVAVFVAFACGVLVGVLFNQGGLAALNGPFETIATAFWDKRLETYRLSVHGIWANVLGRMGWQVAFATLLHRPFVKRMKIQLYDTPFSSAAVNLRQRGVQVARKAFARLQ